MRHLVSYVCVILIALGYLSSQVNGADSEVAANSPISIENSTPVEKSDAPGVVKMESPPEAATEAAPTTPASVEPEPAADVDRKWISPKEQLPLGAVAESTASGVTLDSSGSDAEANSLGKFDPRTNEWVKTFGSLAVVVVLILLLKGVVGRFGRGLAGRGGRPSGVLEILARYPVGRGQSVVLMKLGRRLLLLHQNGSSMTTLSEISDPEEVANLLGRVEAGGRSNRGPSFETALNQWASKHDVVTPQGRINAETIDLTGGSNGGLFASLFGGKGGSR